MNSRWRALFFLVIAAPSLTIDDSGHPPETQQDQESKAVEGVFVEDEDNVQHKGNHHDKTVKHLKFVIEELPAIGVELPHELHHEKGKKSQAQVVENLQRGKQGVGDSEGKKRERDGKMERKADVGVWPLEWFGCVRAWWQSDRSAARPARKKHPGPQETPQPPEEAKCQAGLLLIWQTRMESFRVLTGLTQFRDTWGAGNRPAGPKP